MARLLDPLSDHGHYPTLDLERIVFEQLQDGNHTGCVYRYVAASRLGRVGDEGLSHQRYRDTFTGLFGQYRSSERTMPHSTPV